MTKVCRSARLLRVFALTGFVFFLPGCAGQSTPPLPSVPPAVISKPTAVPPRPEAAPTPTAAAKTRASEYLPFEDIFLRYYDTVSNRTIESAIEFFSEETGLVQRHFTGGDAARIEVSQYREGAIVRMLELNGIDYFQNFTPMFDLNREVLIKEPIAMGTKWEVPGGIREITALDKRVQFPKNRFGEFSVLEITTRYDDKRLLVQQYMKNVGLVAEKLTDSNGSLVRDMQVFEREKGRAITRIVRFYYVYLKANELRYIDREISLRTNSDLKAKFADEWRNVPPGSGLIPLSPDVAIIRMHPRNGSVIVDFTNAFIDNMKIGAEGERLLLQAITNTLAGYYKLQSVYFYVEGVPYQTQSTSLDPLGYLMPTSDAIEYK